MDRTAAERVKQAKVQLLLGHPFFAALAMRLECVEDATVPAAATDGKRVLYNPEFVKGLTVSEATGLLAHEVLHVANLHPFRRDGREAELWNVACDHAINHILKDAGLTLPKDVLLDARFKGMSAEGIYSKLNQERQAGQPQPQPQPWGDVLDNTDDDAAAQEAETQVAVLQAAGMAKAQGKLPAGLERLLDEIKQPAIDWRAALRRFVEQSARADYSWRMPNPRYLAGGLYLPSLQSEQMPPIVVAVDTSGSIQQSELDAFAAEIQGIMDEVKPEGVTVIYCDHQVQGVEEFTPDDMVTLHAKGGGGTCFAPVFAEVERGGLTPACLVYLTDMYGSFPNSAPDYPVLWVSTSEINTAPFGEVLRFPREGR